jgi:hypothetical protein
VEWASEWALERLLGEWRLERTISGQGQMSGTASFQSAENRRVLYRESGELLLESGTRLHGEQRYFYERTDGGFAVYFHGTGELFEQVILAVDAAGDWIGRAEHLCVADVYASEYLFRVDGTFEVRHQVRGPRKDYTIRTVYVRD